MSVECILPKQEDPEDRPREWHEDVGWRTSDACTHEYCVEADGFLREFRATPRITRDEREAIESDHELMLDEFHEIRPLTREEYG